MDRLMKIFDTRNLRVTVLMIVVMTALAHMPAKLLPDSGGRHYRHKASFVSCVETLLCAYYQNHIVKG